MKKIGSLGFTLIELLVVIGILAILLAITLIAINPAKQFGNANDTKRASDVNAILNAVNQYMADNKGIVPPGIPAAGGASPVEICEGTTCPGGASTTPGLCNALVATYIAQLPTDPLSNLKGAGVPSTSCAAYDTGYEVQQATGGRITVTAPTTYSGTPISVTR